MNIKKWFHLFWTTLLIGSLGAVAAGLALQGITGAIPFKGISDLMLFTFILFGYGMLVSVYSQLGFFAYLILNYMGFGVFQRKIWQYIQLVLALLALFDLFFLRSFIGGGRSLIADLALGLSILFTALAVAHFKVRDTNASAWIPTFFFMTGITIVEMIGVLRIGVDNATLFIVVPLIACNAFQILRLHRILQPAAE
ncbi:KinB signaling pathway activation protein [Paenibacillus rhizophilus]|uniref:KinB signaling pathway activation protein n=1 Tax=Paenibacillus rhizophilus TaxID=1850366 RepID=A0A3N9NVK3_9BACL|nr:KinB-signaling pathway activation protein [Paenibacillus rhizophilus]RQW07861.1 KinB signaling pathway activation protein [Paenibacillus rhizophilus]